MSTTRKKKGKPANNDKNNNTNTNGDESEDTNQPAVDTSTINKDEGDSINTTPKFLTTQRKMIMTTLLSCQKTQQKSGSNCVLRIRKTTTLAVTGAEL